MNEQLGIFHMLQTGGIVIVMTALALLVMSVISWTVIKLLAGRARELDAPLIVLSVLFVVKLGWFNA